MLIFFPLIALLIQLATASGVRLHRRVDIPTPSNDPFYNPPNGWKNASNGDILRTWEVDLAFLQLDKFNYKAAYQIMYRTTGTFEDEPSTTVTTVIVPYNAQPNKLLNYLVYTDAVGAQCRPSYGMRKGGNFGNDLALSFQQLLLTTFLNEGYILSVPDYQGPNRSFFVSRLEGRMILDAARAAIHFKPLGLNKNTPMVTYGYSGGSFAAGWAAALQPKYAPELNVIGFGMGGTVANLTNTVDSCEGTLFSGFSFAAAAGFLFAYPKLQDWAKDKITSEGQTALQHSRANCLVGTVISYPFQKLFSSEKYIKGKGNKLYDPVVQSIIGDMVMGLKKEETPKAPIYMFHAHNDEIVPFSDAIKAAKNWANNGADVYFQEFTDFFMGHIDSELSNIPNVLFFVRDRFQGKQFPRGFTHKPIPNPLTSPNAPLKGLDALIKDIKSLIGAKVGPSDSILKGMIKNHS